jgi:nucleoside-diphosphate-sugar epimerase
MTAIVLFGSTGFLGSQVKERLSDDPRVSRLVCPGRARIDLLAAGADDVAGLLREVGPSIVLTCVGRLAGGYGELLRGNALATAIILEAVAEAAPEARFVRLGSAAEYGPAEPGHSLAEHDPARPVTPYGTSHLAGTLLVGQAAAAGQVDGLSLRIFNPVGPGVTGESLLGRAARLLGRAVAAGAGHIDLGPLGAHRDFVDVRDVADAVVRAAFVADPGERVLNVGCGRAVAVREAVTMLAAELGFEGEIRESEPGSARSADVGWSQADTARVRRVLGWRARLPLAESIKAMVSG